jgi:hypothetical protein
MNKTIVPSVCMPASLCLVSENVYFVFILSQLDLVYVKLVEVGHIRFVVRLS